MVEASTVEAAAAAVERVKSEVIRVFFKCVLLLKSQPPVYGVMYDHSASRSWTPLFSEQLIFCISGLWGHGVYLA